MLLKLGAVSTIQPWMKELVDFFLPKNMLALYQVVYSDVQRLQKSMLGDKNSYFLKLNSQNCQKYMHVSVSLYAFKTFYILMFKIKLYNSVR